MLDTIDHLEERVNIMISEMQRKAIARRQSGFCWLLLVRRSGKWFLDSIHYDKFDGNQAYQEEKRQSGKSNVKLESSDTDEPAKLEAIVNFYNR